MLSAEPDRQLTTTHIWPVFLDAAISADAPAEDADACLYESALRGV